MIRNCLRTAAAASAVLLCLTGCQPKEAPVPTESSAVVLETDEGRNGEEETVIPTQAESNLQSESEAVKTSRQAASLEESDYKVFAGQIQKIFSERDIEALAKLCVYPVYVTTETNTEGLDVADAAGLKAQKDDIFTDAMLQAVASAAVDALTPTAAGVFIGSETGSPGLFFSLTENGQLKIMGINSEVINQ